MIKRKQTNNIKEYSYWTSDRYEIRRVGDMKEITEQMSNDLILYINQHPELVLVSHTFIHDNSSNYYDWVLNAIFKKK